MSVQYQCTSCGFHQHVRQWARVYERDEAGSLQPLHWCAWCHCCQKVVDAELVPSIQALTDHLEDVRTHPHGERKLFTWWPPEEEASVTLRYIEWRKGRASPSRCFECGGYSLSFSDSCYGDLPCPQCAGRLEAHLHVIGGTFSRPTPAIYSLEGDLLSPGKDFEA